ncbi:A disintegrin and metalloproteinase with thrombospondin motifs 1-like [Anticarsia gemmatalis]|uniref:A disintegrin and metalloproteinase with thrombospondin motifs 1-like n=1 Tax=Anticarsia gemmatalis TaxID=129554 RepID=UPI003F766168
MPRWLWAAMLVAVAGVRAWAPPDHLVLAPRLRRHAAHTTSRHLQLLGWHLELHENRAIRSPYYNECQFYKGRVLNEEESTATVTDCDGQLYGLLQVGSEEFILEPTRAEGSHVLRRRDVTFSESTPVCNLTGDTVSDFELDFEDEPDPVPVPHVRPRHSVFPTTDYFRMQPISVPVSGVKGLWLEMAIVADHTMMKFHGKERVEHYILALMNIVSAIFNDPSLNSNMTLVINKLFLYEEKDNIIKYGNVKKSLEAVNKWNYRHLMKLPAASTGWDATVWLTRSPLGGPSGFAPVGGVCSRTRSAAIDRDEGLTSAFVIAHELGHLLGLTHDGDSQCSNEATKGSVMAPTVLATLHNYSWSACSKEQFHLKSKRWWCLHERSRDKGVELGGAKEISNTVFTMDEQCRTEFGDGFSVCKSVKVRSACTRLWCAHRAVPHVCRSKRAPPLEGTPCGHNKWCVDRVCEPMPGHAVKTETRNTEITENRVDDVEQDKPEWSEWSSWSDCSADCGYGLRTRLRRCRYRGTISETACDGAGSQVRTCWAGSACAGTRDLRADLCLRQHHRFIPYIHPNDTQRCENWCVDYGGGGPSNFGALPDGIPCSYNQPYDICFQGTCVKGQCNSSDPVCNWCADGYCNNNTHVYTRRLNKGWTRMTMIPHDAHLVSVHIATPISLNIAIRERKKDKQVLELIKHSKRYEIDDNKYLKYDPNVPQNLQIIEVDSHVIDIKEGGVRWEGAAVAAGSLLRWTNTETDVFITSDSRLQTDLMIMAIPEHPVLSGETVSVEVAVNYSTPAGRTRPLEYRWSTERGPCSASCGGGIRVVRPRCLRDHKCAPITYEACNMHSCEFTWAGGEWEECSATCGTDGQQERQLYCVPLNASASSKRELIRSSVSPALCTSPKPNKTQPCNRIQCPVYWREMPWTQCSASCGRGVSRRPLVCPAADERACGPRPRERRRRCRVRACPRRHTARVLPPSTACAPADTMQYCELFARDQLRRFCLVPHFRNSCCNACRDVEREHYRGNG